MVTIDLETARRFILGKQGLWPGRRWRGPAGVDKAIRAMEYLQLDPLQVVARSQDIALHSRVLEYRPGMWQQVTYAQRRFFDWGGWLAVRPMDELPFWRVVMRRERDGTADHGRGIREMGAEHADAVNEMLAILRERGVVANRDFDASSRKRTQSYRGRKDSALALYYLWRIGDVMTHHREDFERVYALSEAVAPAEFLTESSEEATDRFLVKKEIAFFGLCRLQRTGDAYYRGVPFGRVKGIVEALLADDEIIEVRVEGWKPIHYALRSDVPIIEELSAGRTPPDWAPAETSTTEEAVILAPLDPVSARGRAKLLFNFDYVWEVYKPASARKYGYYTKPVLWKDQLVARFDSKLDRATRTLVILGFWGEDEAIGRNEAFAEAFAKGLARFAAFLGADRLDVQAINEPLLRRSAEAARW